MVVKYDCVEPDIDSAFNRIREYFKQYHPAGYGTVVTIEPTYKGYELHFKRYASCD